MLKMRFSGPRRSSRFLPSPESAFQFSGSGTSGSSASAAGLNGRQSMPAFAKIASVSDLQIWPDLEQRGWRVTFSTINFNKNTKLCSWRSPGSLGLRRLSDDRLLPRERKPSKIIQNYASVISGRSLMTNDVSLNCNSTLHITLHR